MLNNITYYMILGKPLIMYIGILTFLLLIITASIGAMVMKGIGSFDVKWHKIIAGTTIAVALMHAMLGILAYF